MSDQDKFRRMLDMLMVLSNTYGASIDKLAARYDISKRSIYRYIKTFKDVGFVVKKNGNLYKVETLDTEYSDIAELVYFSEDDSYLLSQTIHQLADEDYKHQQLAQKLATIYNSGMIASQLVPKREIRKVKDLIAAHDENVQVTLKQYRYGGGDEGMDVDVEPFAFSDDLKGIWAYDISGDKNVYFRIGRITEVDMKGTPWQHTHKHRKGNIDVFGGIGFGNHRSITMEFDRVGYAEVRRQHPRAVDYVSRIYSERYSFEGPVINYEGVGRFVLAIPDHVKVLSPNAFKDYLKDKAAKIMKY